MAAAIIAISVPTKTHASTATGTMTVTASVAKNCAFTTGTLAFGAYDPVSTNGASGADLKVTDSTSALTLTCTKGTSATITLNNGTNSTGCTGTGPACLSDGTDKLNYGVYTDNTFGTLWTGTTTVSYTATAVGAPLLKVNGTIYKGQSVGVGSYTDTITATATY
jgi:spore coat protein U-like protein